MYTVASLLGSTTSVLIDFATEVGGYPVIRRIGMLIRFLLFCVSNLHSNLLPYRSVYINYHLRCVCISRQVTQWYNNCMSHR